jgi:hypothetical protein
LYLPKRPEDRRRTRDPSTPAIYCEFCSARVTYVYVGHANKQHRDTVSKIWIGCDECGLYFPNSASLAGHKRSKHSKREAKAAKPSPPKSFVCEFCSRTFCKAKVLYGHASRHHFESVSKLWHHCKVRESRAQCYSQQ